MTAPHNDASPTTVVVAFMVFSEILNHSLDGDLRRWTKRRSAISSNNLVSPIQQSVFIPLRTLTFLLLCATDIAELKPTATSMK